MASQIAEHSNAFDPFVKSLAEILKKGGFKCSEADVKACFFPGILDDEGKTRKAVASRIKSYGHAKLVLDFISQNGLEGRYGADTDQAEQLKRDVRSIIEGLAQDETSGIARMVSNDETCDSATSSLAESVAAAFESMYQPFGDLFRASLSEYVRKIEDRKSATSSISCDASCDKRFYARLDGVRQSRIDLLCHITATALGGPSMLAADPLSGGGPKAGAKPRVAKSGKPADLGNTPKLGAAAMANGSTERLSFERPPSLMSLTEIFAGDDLFAIEDDPHWFDGSADYVRMGKSAEDNEVVTSYDASTGLGSCISRWHAVIRQESGSWLLHDNGSTNGTAVLRGGDSAWLLARDGEAPLRSGDLILLAPKVEKPGDKVSIDFNWETGAVLRFRLHHLENI